jgi:hypothetical protein
MTKEILGIYDSKAEAIEVINKLQSLSFTKDQLLVVASDEESIDTIEDSTKLDFGEQVLDTDISWFDELMARFKGETGSESVRDNIMELGVSQLDANRVVGLIDDGKIVVLGDPKDNLLKKNRTGTKPAYENPDNRNFTDDNLLNSQNPFDLMERGEDLSAINRSLEPYENEPTLIESGSNIEMDTEHSMDTNSFDSNATINQNTNQENNASEIQYKGRNYKPRQQRDVRDLVDNGEDGRKSDK